MNSRPGNFEERSKAIEELTAALAVSPLVWGLYASVEESYLMRELVICYTAGGDASVTVTSHAICERSLAARIEHSSDPPSGFMRWGLGRIILELKRRHGLPPDLEQRLADLNEWRKSLYHWGHSSSATALRSRVQGRLNDPDEVDRLRRALSDQGISPRNKRVYSLAFEFELRDTALESIKTTLLVRHWNNQTPLP